MRTRVAKLIATSVAVLCPWCAAPQPETRTGSETWERSDFANTQFKATCPDCDGAMLIQPKTKADFE